MSFENAFTNLTSEQKAKAKASTSMGEIAQLSESAGAEFCNGMLDAAPSSHSGFHCMSIKNIPF